MLTVAETSKDKEIDDSALLPTKHPTLMSSTVHSAMQRRIEDDGNRRIIYKVTAPAHIELSTDTCMMEQEPTPTI